jgi:PII-like signaling protein
VSEDALKLTTYFGERSRAGGRLLAEELLDVHARHGIRCSILLRGAQGFGAKHRHSDRLLTLSEDLPLVSVVVDGRERVEKLMGDLGAIGTEGLQTLERARLGSAELTPEELVDSAGEEALKLTIYLGRYEQVDRSPAFAAVCRLLHDSGVDGASVLLGVDGTRDGERLRARFFAANRHVPLMVMSVGNPKRIASALEQLTSTLEEPLFTIERARVCKRDGVLIQPPHEPSSAAHSQSIRQKLTIITSEAARHDRRPVYLELVRRLRGARAAGATSLRGTWGFHGDHPPHGDRLLAVRRHVPILTVAIDTPERIAEVFPIVDELTHERGLVTSELVPASSTLNAIPPL